MTTGNEETSTFNPYKDLMSARFDASAVMPFPSVTPMIQYPTNSPPSYPNLDNLNAQPPLPPPGPPFPPQPIPYYFTPEQIVDMDEIVIDSMHYLDINRLYESLIIIHQRGLMDIQTYTDYVKLKQIEQLVVNALYKDTENWRIMLSSYDKCHRVNQARLTFLKDQHDKRKF